MLPILRTLCVFPLISFGIAQIACIDEARIRLHDASSNGDDHEGHLHGEIDLQPEGFPPLRALEDNDLSRAKAELGRYLFYDSALSQDSSMSCATCHKQEFAFTDGEALSPALHEGTFTKRNSMSLTNVAYTPFLTWVNPTITRLKNQAAGVFFGEDPAEFGVTGFESEILGRIETKTIYQQLFPPAFPYDENPWSYENIFIALEAFQMTLISNQSPYDAYISGDSNALSESAKRGLILFNSERLDCTHCHNGFNFAGPVISANTANVEMEFFNTGLYNIDGEGGLPNGDLGLAEHTSEPYDIGKFRAPTLRNIELTAPYMHDGSVETLEDVIRIYARGGRLIENGAHAGDGALSPYKSVLIDGFEITESEIEDLINFLTSLTDEKFISNENFSNPFEG